MAFFQLAAMVLGGLMSWERFLALVASHFKWLGRGTGRIIGVRVFDDLMSFHGIRSNMVLANFAYTSATVSGSSRRVRQSSAGVLPQRVSG